MELTVNVMCSTPRLQVATLDPDGLALGVPDRWIERIDEKHVSVTAIPGFTQSGGAEIKIGTYFLQHSAEVLMQLVHCRSSPVPVAIVDAEDPKPRLENKRVRDHRIVWIRVLLNVEVLLHGPLRVTQKWPQGPQGVAKLVEVERVVGADDREPGVGNTELRIAVDQVQQK